jgi:hypothetical protein
MNDLSLVLLCMDQTMRALWPIALGFLERIRMWHPSPAGLLLTKSDSALP